jgi:hypothetical protein
VLFGVLCKQESWQQEQRSQMFRSQ